MISNQQIVALLERMPTDQELRVSHEPGGEFWRVEIREKGGRKCVQWFSIYDGHWRALTVPPGAVTKTKTRQRVRKTKPKNPFL